MATKFDSVGFKVNGKHSSEFGIINVQLNSALFEEDFLPNRALKEDVNPFTGERFFLGYTYEPSTFELTLAFQDPWNNEENYEKVQSWLRFEGYREMIFDNYPNFSYYVTYIDAPKISHNGLKQGYITIQFQQSTSERYGKVYERKVFIGSGTIRKEHKSYERSGKEGIEIHLKGTSDCFPIVVIEKYGASKTVKIKNKMNSTGIELDNISLGDVVTVDCDFETIDSELNDTFFYNDLKEIGLKLSPGRNVLLFEGEALVRIKYQPIYK